MLFTALFLVALVALLAISVILWAVMLRIGLRWMKVDDITPGRVALTTAVVLVLETLLTLGCAFVSQFDVIPSSGLSLLKLGASVLIPIYSISWIFKITLATSLRAWLPTLVAPVILFPFALFAFRPYLYESYSIPTNSMAPTLVGIHWKGVCTECGQPTYCTPIPPDQNWREPPLRICESNFHITQPDETGGAEFSGDCLIAAKILKPQRWDLVIFQLPSSPDVIYVKRLVGLPGEEITIRDGKVRVDGNPLTPPKAIRGIQYTSEVESSWSGRKLWGAPDNPAKLGDDEYFFLGDFSPRAADSRFWEVGEPGHNPYAVPESHIRGVVTTIYWPPSRWRSFK